VHRRPAISEEASKWLDLCRGLAALSVFASHWRELYFVHYDQVTNPNFLTSAFYFVTGFGHSSVVMFFVLSGLLVGGSASSQIDSGRFSARAYAIARLTRLEVVLIPALLIGFGIDHLGVILARPGSIYFGGSNQRLIQGSVLDYLGWKTLVGNLFFLQTIVCTPLGTNRPLWSLANEFWYYTVFPIAYLGLRASTRLRQRILLLAISCFLLALVGKSISEYFVVWMLGFAVSRLRGRCLPSPITISISLSFLLCLTASRRSIGFAGDLPLAISFSAVCWLILNDQLIPLSDGLSGCSNRLSSLSYTLYLTHLPILFFIFAQTNRPVQPASWEVIVPLAAFLAAMSYSVILYLLFERHTDKVRAWATNIFANWIARAQPLSPYSPSESSD
jgi:peptidoglycan/LPS O-acetylase OafA/YrhL